MKKVLIIFSLLLCVFSVHVVFANNNTETVLLGGNIIGFEIDDYEETNQDEELIPTSSKRFGTVTFIKKDTNEFVALGHSLTQYNDNQEIQGKCYEANLLDIFKSQKDMVGELIVKVDDSQQIGELSKTSDYGITGKIDNLEEENYQEIETASRYQIKLGKAEILMSLDGENLESYEVEIVGINYFANNKNIKVKIVDQELIEKTGGVVQGMSGTPLVQNGKLVGAINYANTKNPEEACAIFVDKLI